MSDLSTAPRARLVTAFGTVLYVDVASGELRHGPIESSPANAVFVADPSSAVPHRRGWLMHDAGGSSELLVCLADRCHSVSRSEEASASASPTVLKSIPLERGLIAFKAGDFFLSAIPDGRISLSGPVCSTWELFLASEAWCTDAPATADEWIGNTAGAKFDKKGIESYIVDPLIRARANTKPKARKVLIYGYTKWSHGRVYYDLCKQLHRRGYIVDILDWQRSHAGYFDRIVSYYDLFMTALDGVRSLLDTYGVPYDRIIALSHHEFDMRMLIEEKGIEVFEKFANYGVVSEYLYSASLMRGVPRTPMVASLGINFSDFYAEIPEHLTTVGYAGSMSVNTFGVEWKRGELAEASARDAELAFKVAGWTGNQISFHDMPDFYRTVDAVLATSISEGAGLPVMEAAAAGRLVIGTPVGHFPLKAYQGGGIIAPIEAEKFKAFTIATLKYYKENSASFQDKCRAIQEAARKFDWQYSIGEWIDLIEAASNPKNWFERARSLQASGNSADAARFFLMVASAKGLSDMDDELSWCARWQKSRCHRDLGDEEAFVCTALAAFRERPHRAEPLHDLAHYYLSRSLAVPAALYAEAALALPKPEHDTLFVDETMYQSGLRHTFAATANWSPDAEQKERGHKVCDWLALSRDVPAYIRGPARYNLSWYATSAQLLLPSLQFHPLAVTAPNGFHAANLSICRVRDRLIGMVRAVNWILLTDRPGYEWAYLPGHSSGQSKLLLLEVDCNLDLIGTDSIELPDDMPEPQCCEDLGFADPRPFLWRGELWCLSLVRQLNPSGRSEMVLSRVTMLRPDHYVLSDWRQVPSGLPAREEKNWMPQVIDDALRFVYSVGPTRILTDTGEVLQSQAAEIAAENFRGGSQAVPFDGGWLLLIHEVELINTKQHYFHRFIWLDAANILRRISRRFYFRIRGIEFAAGMTWHPDGERLVISFSVNDNDQFLADVAAHEVRTVLSEIRQLEQANREIILAAASALDRLEIEIGFSSET